MSWNARKKERNFTIMLSRELLQICSSSSNKFYKTERLQISSYLGRGEKSKTEELQISSKLGRGEKSSKTEELQISS